MQAQIDIQAMIYSALNGNISAPVYDDVPQDFAPFPFVVIGDDTFNEDSTDTKSGFNASITIHVWSRDAGYKQTKELQAEIYALLHRQPLDTGNNNYGVAGVTFDYSNTMLESDSITRHGIIRFTLYTAETL